MYKSYFHLSHYPFHNTPDPEFYFNSLSHREALATMAYGVQEGKGFVLIIGDVGTGKTMLAQALKRDLGEKYLLIEIGHPWVTPEDVLSAICTRLGLSAVEREDPALMEIIKRKLIEMDEQGQRVVLVIDEAHQLPERTLEGIRLLSNIETTTRKLIQIVLLGQEELSTILGQYSLRQLQQRIAFSYQLLSLSEQETEEYIHHRLRVAGGNVSLFPKACVALIHAEASGSPRVINQLCDNCLLIAFGKNIPAVDVETVREAIERLRPAVVQRSSRWGQPESTPSVAPALPPTEMPPLPFQIPVQRADEGWLPDYSAAGKRNNGRKFPLYMLILILAAGAGGVWLSQNNPLDFKNFGGILDQGRRAPPSAPESISPPQAASPSENSGLPVPFAPERIEQSVEVNLTEKEGLSLVASSHYGAWNDTVRDILYSANPQLSSLEGLPPNTRVKLPRLSRQEMLVQDGRGGFYIYYASFDSEEMAKSALESLKKVWDMAFIATAERRGIPMYRIYIGSYASKIEAEGALRPLWFSYLPILN